MAQTATPNFGYSARAIFGKDHVLPDYPKQDLPDDAKKLLKYIVQLENSTGRQFDHVLGRLHHTLRTTGKDLDENSPECMDKVFAIMLGFAKDDQYSRTARWKIRELLDLRANGWQNADDIVDYYEDPANFGVVEVNNNKVQSPQAIPNPADVRLPQSLYVPQCPVIPEGPSTPFPVQRSNSTGTISTTPDSLRSRTPSGGSSSRSRVTSSGGNSTRSRVDSGGSSRSRNTSGGNTPRSNSSVSSGGLRRQNSPGLEDEDVFHDANESFPDDASNSSGDSRLSRAGSDASSGKHSASSATTAQFRLMQISAGKSIKYTRNYLLGCWYSPLCAEMPSNLQHTIANSDIAYIITGEPFTDPVSVVASKCETPTTLLAPSPPALHSMGVPHLPPPPPLLLRSMSVPSTMPPPSVLSPPPIPLRSMSSSGFPYPGMLGVQKNYVPVIQKEAWQRMFKLSLQQMNPNKS